MKQTVLVATAMLGAVLMAADPAERILPAVQDKSPLLVDFKIAYAEIRFDFIDDFIMLDQRKFRRIHLPVRFRIPAPRVGNKGPERSFLFRPPVNFRDRFAVRIGGV